MPEPLPAAQARDEICLLPADASRHGLIAGATDRGGTR